jgi:antitoxin MazE
MMTTGEAAPRRVLKAYDIHTMIYIKSGYHGATDMQVSKWGNSLAVRLPKKLVEDLGLVEGDSVNVVSADAETIVIAKDDGEGDFIRRLRELQKPRPKGFIWNREDANKR